MQFASAGTGSAIHLGCALMNLVAGLDALHVPYRGANPAMQDLALPNIAHAQRARTAPKGIDVRIGLPARKKFCGCKLVHMRQSRDRSIP